MVTVNYIRDGLIEESHIGYLETSDKPTNFDRLFYLRSCAKPLQATLLIDNNINLESDELALCCGSHSGEDCHIEVAKRLLDKFNIKESELKCGLHAPLSRSMQNKMLLRNEIFTSLHNNCSGKHIGFLILCKKFGWNTNDYDDINHPLQNAIKNKINSLCEVDKNYPITTDGCGVPILSMPLKNMLIGFKNLNNYPQIINAIKNNPYIFGGENRLDTEIIEKSKNLIAKVGAGGLCIVQNIKTNENFVVKIEDCSMEARRFVVLEIINNLNWENISFDKNIKTLNGKIVGHIDIKY